MYIKYIFKELAKGKSKTATIVLTISIVTAILILFSGVMNAYSTGIYKPFKDMGSDIVLQKQDKTTSNSNIRMPFGKGLFNKKEVSKLSALNHVQNFSGSLILWNFNKKGFISIEGLEKDSVIFQKREAAVDKGRFLKNDGEAVLEKHFAKFNNLKVGSSIPLGNKTFNVVGTLASEDGQVFSSNVYLTADDAYDILGADGFNQIYLKIDDISNEKQVKNEVKQISRAI